MLFRYLCPNCGGTIDEGRLLQGLPCSICLPSKYLSSVTKNKKNLRYILERLGHAKGLVNTFLIEDELQEFSTFFNKCTGRSLWNIQRFWAKRLLSRDSFALIAPTGVGKSTLLQVYALYRALKGSKVLYVVPTRELVKQVMSCLGKYLSYSGYSNKVTITTSDMIKQSLVEGRGLDAEGGAVLVTTHAFLHRNKELMKNLRFDVVIVDDFDALLKSSAILYIVLKMVGINEECVSLANKIENLKSEILYYRVLGDEEKLNKLYSELYDAELNLTKLLNRSTIGQLLIASATGRARGKRAKVLRELLGFEVGSILDYMRNIVEVIEPLSSINLYDLLRNLRGGTLIFVSKDLGITKAKEIVNELSSMGFKVELAHSRRALEMFRKGEVDILVGISTYYGILTRGIDLPERVYNVVFIGIPKFVVPLKNLLLNPISLLKILTQLRSLGYNYSSNDEYFMKTACRLSPAKIRVLRLIVKGNLSPSGKLGELANIMMDVISRVEKFICDYVNTKGKLVLDSYVMIKRGDNIYALIPDIPTYIQASGRSSRLFKGHMTLGLSILLYEDEDLLSIFLRRVKNYLMSFRPLRLREINLGQIQEEQIRSRSSDVDYDLVNRKIKSVLIVVESPTKARTIAGMFGRPGRRYIGEYVAYETVITLGDEVLVATIAPTMGHIYDLVVDEGYYGVSITGKGSVVPVYTTIKRCRSCGYQFTDEVSKCPRCGSIRIRNSISIVNALRKLAQEVDYVVIATDPDDEGEKIAYDVYLTIRPYVSNIVRAEFHEVTKHEFLRALMSPRSIIIERVNAQVVRRVDDRLIGFELSNILKKRFSKYWLGGGRVQTPVLNWICSRYFEYLKSRGYLVIIKLLNGKIKIKYFVDNKSLADKIIDYLNEKGVKLVKLRDELRLVSPKPPYTTDTLLQDGSKVLRLPPSKIMKIAQDLFELGLITYHRTDSTHVSSQGIEVAKEYIRNLGLTQLLYPRPWGIKGTHECIRPTRPIRDLDITEYLSRNVNLTYYHKRLYEMIFDRFIASQLRHAKVLTSIFKVTLSPNIELVVEVPVKVVENGFNVVEPIMIIEELGGVNEVLFKDFDVKIVKSSKLPLYSTADVVRLMREERIGRPSTYAKAIENNLRHGYVVLSKKKLKLIPTRLGIDVISYVKDYFPELTTPEATRRLEQLLDLVRLGRLSREEALALVLADVADLLITKDVKEVTQEVADVST